MEHNVHLIIKDTLERYRIQESLGQGSQGTVYIAEDLEDPERKLVALKQQELDEMLKTIKASILREHEYNKISKQTDQKKSQLKKYFAFKEKSNQSSSDILIQLRSMTHFSQLKTDSLPSVNQVKKISKHLQKIDSTARLGYQIKKFQ
ncbi:UNKNOWN [Stylonychia lemnae]|uniref:Protein kinase domain-containing protein n=1 Tax=Stylonychia lemnae TaxID=5949 RepID=A0A077ZVA3_STYLE|nr:UNKNOWN [Stylonychia lemnae]|eukprot:CDW72346.1 UNKNOWN [Stylonychia lemnae]